MVFKMKAYDGWTELSPSELKVKCAPYKEIIKETWARLKRAMPEMQSAAKPFVKHKWDERAVFLVQDVTYEAMDACF